MTIIEALCDQLVQEATAVKATTQTIESLLKTPNHDEVTDTLDDIRAEKAEHIQKLTLLLVSQFYDIGDEKDGKQS